MLRHSIQIAPLIASIALGVGCFNDPGGTVTCPSQTNGCPCLSGGCAAGLECLEDYCREPNCRAGLENCPCNDGTCSGDLICLDGATCRQPGGGETSTTSVGETTDPSTTVDVTGVSMSMSDSVTDSVGTSSTTVLDTSVEGSGTGPVPAGYCGWETISENGQADGYWCTDEPDLGPNPAAYPCGPGAEAGLPCNSVSPPVTSIPGCCVDEVTLAWCDPYGLIFIEHCDIE